MKKLELFLLLLMTPLYVYSQRAIPDDNLAYPILIKLDDNSTGSGFYINAHNAIYLVTAKHVLFNAKDSLNSNYSNFISYSRDPNEKGKNELRINLKYMLDNGYLKFHPSYDVTIMKIGGTEGDNEKGNIKIIDSVKIISTVQTGLVTCPINHIKKYVDVLVANEIFLFGYPTSLGIQKLRQFDYNRPLLRKGIVAGKFDSLKTIIIDCPSYYGNSGGPVVEITFNGVEYRLNLIGVVSQFIPFVEKGINEIPQYSNYILSNSGFSVCISMDTILELIDK